MNADEKQEAVSLINEASAQAPQEQPTQAEMMEYYLGGKANRLPANAEFVFKEAGKVDKVPLSKMVNGYRSNAVLSKKVQEYTQKEAQWKDWSTKQQDYENRIKTYEPYKQLQEWSQDLELKNPVAFKYLMDTIDRVKSGAFTGGEQQGEYNQVALNNTIADLNKKLSELSEWKSQFETQAQEKQAQEDRKFVDGEIDNLKKQFPEINLDELDETGISLTSRIEAWGVEQGYRTFTDAYRAYFWDKLPEIFAQRGKNEAIKGQKKSYADGIIARSSTPFTSGHPTQANQEQNIKEEFLSLLNR